MISFPLWKVCWKWQQQSARVMSGLLLDAWHLYTSGGSVDDLDKISKSDIVNVHVNDAPRGLTMAEIQRS